MMASPIHSRRVALAGGFTFDMAVRQGGGVFPSDERAGELSTGSLAKAALPEPEFNAKGIAITQADET